MVKKIITVALLASSLVACKSTPPPADVSLTNNPSITYKLPLDQSVDIKFDTYNRCVEYGDSGSCMKSHMLKFERKAGNVVVERRVASPINSAGSKYTIQETTSRDGGNSIITYQPLKLSSYETGLLAPNAPKIDLADYLSTTQFSTKFEINSDFPSVSVKANFDRLMNKARNDFRVYGNTSSDLDLEDYYMVDVEGAQVVMLVESFPYRNGSKIVVNAVVQTRKPSNGVIDVAAIMKSLEEKVGEVVNS